MADGLPAGVRPPRLGAAIVGAFGSTFEWAFAFVVANAAWLLAIIAFGFVVVGFPIAALAAPILALPTASLMRLAVAAVRAEVPTLRMARAELTRLAGRKVVLAALQLLLIGLGLTNLRLAADMGGLPGILAAAVSVYAVVGTSLLAIALWPLVCDPAREAPMRAQLRLALAVLLRRPAQVLVLAIIAGLALVVAIQLIVPAVFLPSLVFVAVAGYVVPAADELVAPSG